MRRRNEHQSVRSLAWGLRSSLTLGHQAVKGSVAIVARSLGRSALPGPPALTQRTIEATVSESSTRPSQMGLAPHSTRADWVGETTTTLDSPHTSRQLVTRTSALLPRPRINSSKCAAWSTPGWRPASPQQHPRQTVTRQRSRSTAVDLLMVMRGRPSATRVRARAKPDVGLERRGRAR